MGEERAGGQGGSELDVTTMRLGRTTNDIRVAGIALCKQKSSALSPPPIANALLNFLRKRRLFQQAEMVGYQPMVENVRFRLLNVDEYPLLDPQYALHC